jgi:hypothetical protein
MKSRTHVIGLMMDWRSIANRAALQIGGAGQRCIQPVNCAASRISAIEELDEYYIPHPADTP